MLSSSDTKIKNKVMIHALHWSGRLLAAGLLFLASSIQAQAASQQVLRPELQQQFRLAQETFAAKQYQHALGIANEILGNTTLTDYERLVGLRVRAAIATEMKDWNLAIESLEAAVSSNAVDELQRLALLESLLSTLQRKNDAPRIVKWSKVYLASGGSKPTVRLLLIESLLLQSEYQQVVDEMQKFTISDTKRQSKASEGELRSLAIAYKNLKDDGGYSRTIKKLLELYPSKIYLKESIANIANQAGFSSRWSLDLYRLLDHVDGLDDEESFIEMINLALKAGLPIEAQRIAHKAFVKGVLGRGAEINKHVQLRDEVTKRVQADEKLNDQTLKLPLTLNSLLSMAEVHFSKQEWNSAHEAYTKALTIGAVRRENEVRLHDGIALLKIGLREQALQQFDRIKGDETAVEIAYLWRQLIAN
jgi:tetratricopeptide (TPR) repeat protein